MLEDELLGDRFEAIAFHDRHSGVKGAKVGDGEIQTGCNERGVGVVRDDHGESLRSAGNRLRHQDRCGSREDRWSSRGRQRVYRSLGDEDAVVGKDFQIRDAIISFIVNFQGDVRWAKGLFNDDSLEFP
jgi:hypothetical protein